MGGCRGCGALSYLPKNSDPMAKLEPYQPSNSSDGDWFLNKFCMKCKNCDPDSEGEKQCNILMRSMVYSISDPEYPKEWVYKDGEPICKSHEPWDWKELGNPDDPENENYVMPFNPDQLKLF